MARQKKKMAVHEHHEKAETIGEELWLVHMKRHENETPSEDDVDRIEPIPRKRSHSVGEELWEIHLKRSRGMDPDYDSEVKESIKEVRKPVQRGRRSLSLRNRSILIKL